MAHFELPFGPTSWCSQFRAGWLGWPSAGKKIFNDIAAYKLSPPEEQALQNAFPMSSVRRESAYRR
jgi:hypothetical protein